MVVIKSLQHEGTKRHSGRYPWGSGKNPYQRDKGFLQYVDELREKGMSNTEIAKGLGMTTTELIQRRSVAKDRVRAANASAAMRLKEKGWSNTAIGERFGVGESTVRSWLDPAILERTNITAKTADILKDAVDTKGLIDIGAGTEQHLAISRTKLDTAVSLLKDEGYTVHEVYHRQQFGDRRYTTMKVLAPPGMTTEEVYKRKSEIKMVSDYYTEDGGRSWLGIEPNSIDGKRVLIRYAEEGGDQKDGVIQLRPGVDDISLGDSHYAQVRIGVDDTHYMKGMALYGHPKDFPPGVDIIYNTTKKKGTPPQEVYKPMVTKKETGEIDLDNPYGSTIRQKHYTDPVTGEKRLSKLNVVGMKEGAGEEGSWSDWSRTLSSQILSKQAPALAKRQLDLSFAVKMDEFDEIMKLTNPAVKRRLLESFSDECDADAVHLKAAALPRQGNHVLLPFNSIKPTEVYAPNYNNGDTVVLIRHPHGGIFEIPQLTVNNKNPEAKSLIGRALDAVGIHPSVAARLSGADFDGDTVLVIPNKRKDIQISGALDGLKNFDPKTAYPKVPGMKLMDGPTKQTKMGDISNLITDMTIKGANQEEIARAVRHSMVVIDAEKHGLNYQQSYIDNGIASLKKRYQGKATGGASTLISKANSPIRIDERKAGKYVDGKKIYIDPDTGKKLYTKTGRTYKEVRKVKDPVTGKIMRDPISGKILYEETGRVLSAKTKLKKMAFYDDASTLSSGTRMENIYAGYANSLKDLANRARRELIATPPIKYSPSARQTFDKEVSSLRAKLSLALRNKPLERQAQLLTSTVVARKVQQNPLMDDDDLKKLRTQALDESRRRFGAQRNPIIISDREWLAIQAGAISNNTLLSILKHTDMNALKQRATPRQTKGLSPAKLARARAMLDAGHTQAEVANSLGVSVSTVVSAMKE